jgi:hypothetical protein
MPRLVQLQKGSTRCVGLVDEPKVVLLTVFTSVYALAQAAVNDGVSLTSLIEKHAMGEALDYDSIYGGSSEYRLLPPIDHLEEPARCLVTGTGLTHLGSARDREAMHTNAKEHLTDSMKMFRWGVENGRPAPGQVGVAPEWFYKGQGTVLRAHRETLLVPSYADDGGEEAEIAGVYIVDAAGQPHRIGMTIGNEFSDHRFEKKNYLNLAGSKLRTCAVGPELVINPEFQSVPGKVAIERAGQTVWSRDICTGEAEMCHSLRNIEHHHFKFEQHRRAGDVHVHYFGACSLSFGDGVQLLDGDVMQIQFEGFGRPLRNPVQVAPAVHTPVQIVPLV